MRKYIRLAAWFAARPSDIRRVELKLTEVEALLGESLPRGARSPAWWGNDARSQHSRSWISAGWEVAEIDTGNASIVFQRSNGR